MKQFTGWIQFKINRIRHSPDPVQPKSSAHLWRVPGFTVRVPTTNMQKLACGTAGPKLGLE